MPTLPAVLTREAWSGTGTPPDTPGPPYGRMLLMKGRAAISLVCCGDCTRCKGLDVDEYQIDISGIVSAKDFFGRDYCPDCNNWNYSYVVQLVSNSGPPDDAHPDAFGPDECSCEWVYEFPITGTGSPQGGSWCNPGFHQQGMEMDRIRLIRYYQSGWCICVIFEGTYEDPITGNPVYAEWLRWEHNYGDVLPTCFELNLSLTDHPKPPCDTSGSICLVSSL